MKRIFTVFILAVMLLSFCGCVDTQIDEKPVIYLYPEEETEVTVKLDYAGELTTTYPEYKDGLPVFFTI
ncbi:MAG: hypothetical protein IJO51_05730 [Clostridia bacterium]|nr:hypothetical protein [Clostridia bacterium]